MRQRPPFRPALLQSLTLLWAGRAEWKESTRGRINQSLYGIDYGKAQFIGDTKGALAFSSQPCHKKPYHARRTHPPS